MVTFHVSSMVKKILNLYISFASWRKQLCYCLKKHWKPCFLLSETEFFTDFYYRPTSSLCTYDYSTSTVPKSPWGKLWIGTSTSKYFDLYNVNDGNDMNPRMKGHEK